MEKKEVYIYGDYVVSAIKNAFNSKISYWLSKKNCTFALYCFTTNSEREVKRQISNINSYISLFEKMQ